MHKLAASVSVLALAALSLVGCAAADSTDCTPVSQASESTQKLVTATGEVGTAPDVEVLTPIHVSKGVSWQPVTGEGTPVTSLGQVVGIDLSLFNGTSGDAVFESSYDPSSPQLFTLTGLDQTLPGVADLLECAQAGSRVIFTLPAKGFAPETLAGFQLTDSDTLVGVVDVHDVYLARANGADQFHTGTGLPSVVRAPDGQPGVVVPDSAAPTDTVVQVVKKGDGAEVEADSLVLVHYTAVRWNDRELVGSTWNDASPAGVQPSAGSQPFAADLEGQTVGSQVMVIVPSGGEESGGGDADGTIYVVDILGIAPAQTGQ